MFEQLLSKHNQIKIEDTQKDNIFVVNEWSFVENQIAEKKFIGILPKANLNISFDKSNGEIMKISHDNDSLIILHSGITVVYKGFTKSDLDSLKRFDMVMLFYHDDKGITFISTKIA